MRLTSGLVALLHRFRRERGRARQRRDFERKTAGMSRQQIFEAYYERKWWDSRESVSGFGSTFAYTENIRRTIPALVRELGVRTLLDAPCGDFNWFQHVALPEGTVYIGADIVPAIVTANNARYGRSGVMFRQLDIVNDHLPSADLWLARAVLNHFSDRDIWAAVHNFLGSSVRYLLTTSFMTSAKNRDIVTGFFRALNLERPPFRFPPPLRVIADGTHVGQSLNLCLWERSELQAALMTNKAYQLSRQRS